MSILLWTDGYKVDHRRQYPKGTGLVYSNWTPRKSRIDGIEEVVLFGLQYFIKKYMIEEFNTSFFKRPKEEVVSEYKRRIDNYLGPNAVGTDHIRALHDLGYITHGNKGASRRLKSSDESANVHLVQHATGVFLAHELL